MSKKLVTIFALHLDSFIVTQNLSSVYQFRKTGSGQFLQPRQLTLSPGLAKNCAMVACPPGQFSG
jgi:hypothetical protein